MTQPEKVLVNILIEARALALLLTSVGGESVRPAMESAINIAKLAEEALSVDPPRGRPRRKADAKAGRPETA